MNRADQEAQAALQRGPQGRQAVHPLQARQECGLSPADLHPQVERDGAAISDPSPRPPRPAHLEGDRPGLSLRKCSDVALANRVRPCLFSISGSVWPRASTRSREDYMELVRRVEAFVRPLGGIAAGAGARDARGLGGPGFRTRGEAARSDPGGQKDRRGAGRGSARSRGPGCDRPFRRAARGQRWCAAGWRGGSRRARRQRAVRAPGGGFWK